MSKIILGIDQSYDCTGVSVWDNLILRNAKAIYPKSSVNTETRNYIKHEIHTIIRKLLRIGDITIVCERVRTASQKFVNVNFIKAQGALVACIVDVAYEYDIEVYSADTRSWKSKIVGTSKPCENKYGVPKGKYPTIKYCIEQGWSDYIFQDAGKRKKGLLEFNDELMFPNDNIADAICIGKYGALFEGQECLKREL